MLQEVLAQLEEQDRLAVRDSLDLSELRVYRVFLGLLVLQVNNYISVRTSALKFVRRFLFRHRWDLMQLEMALVVVSFTVYSSCSHCYFQVVLDQLDQPDSLVLLVALVRRVLLDHQAALDLPEASELQVFGLLSIICFIMINAQTVAGVSVYRVVE